MPQVCGKNYVGKQKYTVLGDDFMQIACR